MERMDMIVEEVLRRLRLLQNRKRILVILRDHSDFEHILFLIGELRDKGYSFSLLSLLSKSVFILDKPEFKDMESVRSGSFREGEYEPFIKGFEGMLVSDLSLLEMKNMSDLIFRETLGQLIYHTIKEDKPVYTLSRDMTGVSNRKLQKRLSEVREELGNLKIHVVMGEKIKDEGRASFKKTEFEPSDQKNSRVEVKDGEVLTERYITLADAVSALHEGKNDGILRISSTSRLTMEAKDYLSRQNVRIETV